MEICTRWRMVAPLWGGARGAEYFESLDASVTIPTSTLVHPMDAQHGGFDGCSESERAIIHTSHRSQSPERALLHLNVLSLHVYSQSGSNPTACVHERIPAGIHALVLHRCLIQWPEFFRFGFDPVAVPRRRLTLL